MGGKCSVACVTVNLIVQLLAADVSDNTKVQDRNCHFSQFLIKV
jgi:hypothetical protein